MSVQTDQRIGDGLEHGNDGKLPARQGDKAESLRKLSQRRAGMRISGVSLPVRSAEKWEDRDGNVYVKLNMAEGSFLVAAEYFQDGTHY